MKAFGALVVNVPSSLHGLCSFSRDESTTFPNQIQFRSASPMPGKVKCYNSVITVPSLRYLSVSSLPASTSLSHAAASQSLVMSPGGVANDNSVTLTLTDTQGMLDGVTLNLNAQVIKKPPLKLNKKTNIVCVFGGQTSNWQPDFFTFQLILK